MVKISLGLHFWRRMAFSTKRPQTLHDCQGMKSMVKANALILIGFFIFAGSARAGNKGAAQKHFLSGEDYRLAHQLEKAVEEYQKAIENDDRYVIAHAAYQDVMLEQLGRGDEIVESYSRMLANDPDDPMFRYLVARLEDDPSYVLRQAKTILSFDPEYYWGYYLLGRASSKLDLDGQAMEAYERAVELDPQQSAAYFGMASIYQHGLKDIEMAKTLYEKALEKNPKLVELKAYIWEIDYALSKNKGVLRSRLRKDIEQVLDIYPNYTKLIGRLYSVCFLLGYTDLGRSLWERLTKLDTYGEHAQMIDINIIQMAPTVEEKIDKAEAFLEKYPTAERRGRVYADLVDLMQRSARYGDADVEALMHRWIQDLPDDELTYDEIVWHYSIEQNKNYEKAVAFLNEGMDALEEDKRLIPLKHLGWVCFQTGRYRAAVDVLEQARRNCYDVDPVALYRLGAAYQESGEPDSAMKYLGISIAHGIDEFENARTRFISAYGQKHGDIEGAESHLYRTIFAASALKKPFRAPDFELSSLKQRTVQLYNHLGDVILINFWKPG